MDPITLILEALLAGATKGVTANASAAVQDAYTELRAALKRKLGDEPAAQAAVEQFVVQPKAWRSNVAAQLQQVEAGSDQVIVAAAAAVMRSTDPTGANTGKYTVLLTDVQGLQIGDNNKQINHFGPHPRSS